MLLYLKPQVKLGQILVSILMVVEFHRISFAVFGNTSD